MAGNFARGFLSTFGDSYRMERASRENAFERMYNTFEQNKQFITKTKLEDAQRVKKAQAIIATRPELANNPAAFKFVYDQVSADRKEELIIKDLDGINISGGTVTPADQQTEEVFTQPSMEAPQSTGAGMAPGAPAAEPQRPTGVLGALTGMFKPREQQFIEKIAKEQGIPVEEAVKIVQLNPSLVESPEIGAPGAQVTTKNATYDGIEPEAVIDRSNKLADGRKEQVVKVGEAKSALDSLTRSGVKKLEIVQRNPAAKTSLVKTVVNALTGIKEEVDAAINLGDPERKAEYWNQRVNETENQIAQIENTVKDASQDALLFDLYTRLDAYTLGKLYSQSGRDLSNQDVQMFMESMNSGRGAEGYAINMKSLIEREAQQLDSRINLMNQDPEVTRHNDNVQTSRYAGRKDMLVPNVSTFTEDMQKNPELKGFYETLMTAGKTPVIGGQPAPAPATSEQEKPVLPEGVTEEDIQHTMKLHNVSREEVLKRIQGQ